MASPRNAHLPAGFVWIAATIATAFAGVGMLIVAGAGQSMIGQIVAVVVGFLLLGAGAAVALAIGVPDTLWRVRGNDDWNHW